MCDSIRKKGLRRVKRSRLIQYYEEFHTKSVTKKGPLEGSQETELIQERKEKGSMGQVYRQYYTWFTITKESNERRSD